MHSKRLVPAAAPTAEPSSAAPVCHVREISSQFMSTGCQLRPSLSIRPSAPNESPVCCAGYAKPLIPVFLLPVPATAARPMPLAGVSVQAASAAPANASSVRQNRLPSRVSPWAARARANHRCKNARSSHGAASRFGRVCWPAMGGRLPICPRHLSSAASPRPRRRFCHARRGLQVRDIVTDPITKNRGLATSLWPPGLRILSSRPASGAILIRSRLDPTVLVH
jgi:hypothetical protein